MKKNDTIELSIDDLGTDGQGIGRYEEMVVFVDGALPGETVQAKIILLKKSYLVGKLEKVVIASPLRVVPPCHVFGKCGGCTLQHLAYAGQLEYKNNYVINCINRIGKLDIPVNFPLPAKKEYRYRNKAAFPVQQNADAIEIGFYARHSHRIVDVDDCMIQHADLKIVMSQLRVWMVKYGLSIYNEKTNHGLLRHIVLRTNKQGDIMLVLCINGEDIPHKDALIALFKIVLPQLKSISLNINTQHTNVIMGDTSVCIYGQDYIFETIHELEYKITAQSFFQVNSEQTEVLYATLLKMLDLKKTDTVVDLYCGTGTISLYAAQRAKIVYGVEIAEQSIENARFNARLNDIQNAEFFVGDVDTVMPTLITQTGKIDAIIVDPPRKGLTEDIIRKIAAEKIAKVGYVSCNPSTLARDLAQFFDLGYTANVVQPVDLFPQTTHVECVCLLTRTER
ncbi:MAG: 23S rRNA (uracil(1939)-C(5))-methyltransferase RlmD [Christensenellaceae bacterium]